MTLLLLLELLIGNNLAKWSDILSFKQRVTNPSSDPSHSFIKAVFSLGCKVTLDSGSDAGKKFVKQTRSLVLWQPPFFFFYAFFNIFKYSIYTGLFYVTEQNIYMLLACVDRRPYLRHLTENTFKKHRLWDEQTGGEKRLTDFQVLGLISSPLYRAIALK